MTDFRFSGLWAISGALLASVDRTCLVRLGLGLGRSRVCMAILVGMVSFVNGFRVLNGVSVCGAF